MYRSTVIDHFGSARKLVESLTNLSDGAVSQWGEIIPLGRAYEIQAITDGKLKVDLSLYEKKQSDTAA